VEPTLHDVLAGRTLLSDTVLRTDEGFDLVPANIDLAGAEAYLLGRTAREFALKEALEDVADRHELIVLDCPPSLGSSRSTRSRRRTRCSSPCSARRSPTGVSASCWGRSPTSSG
jgi:MinD-like ATPase involved in chromosome partitioning or flagellar assembly